MQSRTSILMQHLGEVVTAILPDGRREHLTLESLDVDPPAAVLRGHDGHRMTVDIDSIQIGELQ